MNNGVEKASVSNMEEDKASPPNKGKSIDVGSASEVDKDINNPSTSNMERDDTLNASNKGKDIESTSSIEYVNRDIMEQLQTKMDALTSQQDRAVCCIYRVLNSLRNIKPKMYTPRLISIGPLHRSNKRLEAMEKQKVRYFKQFTKRHELDNENISDLVSSIQKKEMVIRVSYSENLTRIRSSDFIQMILLDAVFVIEFMKDSIDQTFSNEFEPWMIFDIEEDLMLLENQLPFFIIQEIYDQVNLPSQESPCISKFLNLATLYFANYTSSQGLKNRNLTAVESRHFTDLLRNFLLEGAFKRRYTLNPMKLKYSAVMLRKAGVKFQVIKEDKCLVNIKFEKGVLKIPLLDIRYCFERLVRNIMALEQCCYQREAYVCSYIKFMDHLIDSAEDVGLLVRKGIILHGLGDDAAVSNMINHFCKNIGDNYTCFGDISRNISRHYENRFNHTKATLKLIYFPNIWRGTATVAAAILLILTFIQTIASVKWAF